MSEIKAGDLVMIVKPDQCCGYSGAIGKIFTVKKIELCRLSCTKCGIKIICNASVYHNGNATELRRLKKIEPLNDADLIETKLHDLTPV